MRTWQAALGGVAAATLLVGCGGGDDGGTSGSSGDGGSDFAEESASTILDAAEKDMKALSAVKLDGEMTQGDQPVSFAMTVSTSGDCQGTLGIGDGEAEILSLGGDTWMKPDAAFWDAFAGEQAELIKGVVGDKWVLLPGDQGDFTEFCDLDELLSDMGDDDDATEAEVGETEDVGGEEAVQVSSTTDDDEPVTAWVAVDEPHHILKMEVTTGDETGTITFSDFDVELDAEAPAEDDVVDLAQLGA